MPSSAASPGGDERSVADLIRPVLDFEREWWQHSGTKERAIREQFGMSTARYYQVLNSVIQLPDAVRYDPMLVGRLQRSRESRVSARAARVFTARITDSGSWREADSGSWRDKE